MEKWREASHSGLGDSEFLLIDYDRAGRCAGRVSASRCFFSRTIARQNGRARTRRRALRRWAWWFRAPGAGACRRATSCLRPMRRVPWIRRQPLGCGRVAGTTDRTACLRCSVPRATPTRRSCTLVRVSPHRVPRRSYCPASRPSTQRGTLHG